MSEAPPSRTRVAASWLVRRLSPIGLWSIVFCLLANLIAAAVSIQTNRDVISNEAQIASHTNAFLERIQARIQEEEANRLNGDAAFLKEFRSTMATIMEQEQERLTAERAYIGEFRTTVMSRDAMLEKIYYFLVQKFSAKPLEAKPSSEPTPTP